jgi:hypothetical protein
LIAALALPIQTCQASIFVFSRTWLWTGKPEDQQEIPWETIMSPDLGIPAQPVVTVVSNALSLLNSRGNWFKPLNFL